jgi:hypothetical protein
MSAGSVLPHRAQRIVWAKPGMFGALNSRGVGSAFGAEPGFDWRGSS